MRRNWIRLQAKLQQQARELERCDTDGAAPDLQPDRIHHDLARNEAALRDAFSNCADIVFRPVGIDGPVQMLVVYVDGLIDRQLLDEAFLKPLLYDTGAQEPGRWLRDRLQSQLVSVSHLETVTTMNDVIQRILHMNVAVLVSGEQESFILHLEMPPVRAISEPVSETVIRGPREGFTEVLKVNLALLRKKLQSRRLKVEYLLVGDVSETNIALAYIEGIVNESVLEEVRRRVLRIRMDAVIDSGYIEEFIEDSPFSPFPQVQNTERPDVVLANMLEGKVAILVDGTPFGLIVPMTFWGSLQAAEDYYERFLVMSAIRWLRVLLLGIALLLPSLYVALTTFHPQLIPTNLVLTFAAAREPSPFPAVIEALMMELVFEALREAGIRLPKTVGSAVSIVGGLVIGQSAVEAGLVSAPMVIVVATTGIASFALPRYNFALAFRLLRFPLLILAGSLGFFGITVGLLTILIHLTSLRSFGIPYLSPVAPTDPSHLGDVLMRAPRWSMHRRPPLVAGGRQSTRIPAGQKPSPKKPG